MRVNYPITGWEWRFFGATARNNEEHRNQNSEFSICWARASSISSSRISHNSKNSKTYRHIQTLQQSCLVEPIAKETLTTLQEEPTRAVVLLITVSATNRNLKLIYFNDADAADLRVTHCSSFSNTILVCFPLPWQIRTATEATTIRMIMDLHTTIAALDLPNIPHPPEVLAPATEAVRNRWSRRRFLLLLVIADFPSSHFIFHKIFGNGVHAQTWNIENLFCTYHHISTRVPNIRLYLPVLQF